VEALLQIHLFFTQCNYVLSAISGHCLAASPATDVCIQLSHAG